MEDRYNFFKEEFHKMTNINLDFYKEKQMKRRIETLITRQGYDDYENFLKSLKEDEIKLHAFLEYITINVTEFFRTKNDWSYFEKYIIPGLTEHFGLKLNVWSAGCSTGEEPYSLAMSLAEYISLSEIHIIATDIDEYVLNKAKTGLFSEQAMEAVPENFRKKYFIKDGFKYRIKEEVRRCIEFKKMDLTKEQYPGNCHLIVCRNVMIYFTEEVKQYIFKKFYDSLNDCGCLFLGNSEQIINCRKKGYLKQYSSIYLKKEI